MSLIEVSRMVLSFRLVKRTLSSRRKTYTLVPCRICVRNQLPVSVERYQLLVGRRRRYGARFRLRLSGRLLRRRGRRGRRRDLLLGVEGANLQLGFVLLQNSLIVILPELLRGVLAGNALEDWKC
jgi:hypothetical protein